METGENGIKVEQDGGGDAAVKQSPPSQKEQDGGNEVKSAPTEQTNTDKTESTVPEPDSTVTENPVNLKVEGNGEQQEVVNESPPAQQQQQQQPEQRQQRSSPPPLLQHVRTITLTSDYRQHEQNLEAAAQLSTQPGHQMGSTENNATGTTLYVEEGAGVGDVQSTDGSYYQQQHHYTDENGTPVRYREIVTAQKSGVSQVELLDAAAAAAGVPTGHYIMMEGEEDEQDDRTSYLGSRLATFQVDKNRN